MSTASSSPSSSYSRGRSLPRQPSLPHSTSSSFGMDVNNTLVSPLYRNAAPYTRDRTPSPVRRSPYIGSASPSPPGLSRSGSILGHPPLSPSSLGDVKKLNRSSVLHLRNLSEFTRDGDDNPVLGLGIPEIEREEVPGTAGRKRLARGESQRVYAGNKLWVDKQRQAIQAYEYLCHVGEAKQYLPPSLRPFPSMNCVGIKTRSFFFFADTCRWMESCLNQEIPPIVQLEDRLRDGVILARLARVFAPELVPRIFEAEKLQFRHSDNINRFFRFVSQCGLPDVPPTPQFPPSSLTVSNSVSNSRTFMIKRTSPK
jgi:Ras GTPase-activating-like protein IQGAP2/3